MDQDLLWNNKIQVVQKDKRNLTFLFIDPLSRFLFSFLFLSSFFTLSIFHKIHVTFNETFGELHVMSLYRRVALFAWD